jgi:hypothetical protein
MENKLLADARPWPRWMCALDASYGVRNWLDVGGELGAGGFAKMAYDATQVTVMGVESSGRVTRTSRLVRLPSRSMTEAPTR